MTNKKPKPPRQIDMKTVCLGDMLPKADAWLKAEPGRKLSPLVRAALSDYLRADRQAIDPRPLQAEVAQLRSDLARVGSNLNQLAHGFNMRGDIAFDRDALAKSHDALRVEFRVLMDKLQEFERALRS